MANNSSACEEFANIAYKNLFYSSYNDLYETLEDKDASIYDDVNTRLNNYLNQFLHDPENIFFQNPTIVLNDVNQDHRYLSQSMYRVRR